MRLIHRVPFSVQEIESYRQLVFNNLTHSIKVSPAVSAEVSLA